MQQIFDFVLNEIGVYKNLKDFFYHLNLFAYITEGKHDLSYLPKSSNDDNKA